MESRRKLKPEPKPCPQCKSPVDAVFEDPLVKFQNSVFFSGTIEDIKWHFPEFCAACQRQLNAERENKQAEEKLWYEISGTNRHFENLLKFPAHKHMTQNKLSPSLRDFFNVYKDDFSEEKINLFITGKTGCGKTHLAVCLMKKFVVDNGKAGTILPIPYFMDKLRESFDDKYGDTDSGMIEKIIDYDAILLDDVGVGRNNDYVIENLYKIIDRCWLNEKRGLILTSNKTLEELSDQTDDRITSRIAGMCKVIKISGKDFRVEKR